MKNLILASEIVIQSPYSIVIFFHCNNDKIKNSMVCFSRDWYMVSV